MNAFDYFFENTFSLEKDFILGPGETISYKDLYDQSIKLAACLNDKVGRNQNILLLAPNSAFFITAYLAILKSGNVVVPLNPEIEQSNLDFIQDKCQAKITFTTPQISAKLNFEGTLVIHNKELDSIIQQTAFESYTILQTPNLKPQTSNHLAEIIFTSGTTGEPKGVMISHKNLIANTSSILEYLHLTEKDIMLVVLPFYYCYGLSLLHTHLRVGASLVLNNMFIMLGSLMNDLKCFKCTGFAGVPSHFQILLRKSDTFKKTSFPDLKYVTQAGGRLHNSFIREFIDAFPGIKFNVMYGQTEATARLTWLPPDKLHEKMGSCGKAIPGVKLMVADTSGYPVKSGEIGEIMVYGDNIMQGYYKDPEATKKTIKNGWLLTGDLATLDEEGFVYLTARKKEILKVSGRRISPKEIEDVIMSNPEVIDCSIEAVYDELLGESMKATVITREKSEMNTDTIKAWCASLLASYKIPQIVEIKYRMTISATGKKVLR